MPFAPGESGNPHGRPAGPRWQTYAHWFNVIAKNLDSLTPLQRVELAKWAMDFLAKNVRKPESEEGEQSAEELLATLERTSRTSSSGSTEKKA